MSSMLWVQIPPDEVFSFLIEKIDCIDLLWFIHSLNRCSCVRHVGEREREGVWVVTIPPSLLTLPGCLQGYVYEYGPLSPETTLNYSYQLFEALDYLHQTLKIIHCDIKRTSSLLHLSLSLSLPPPSLFPLLSPLRPYECISITLDQ